jgi:hypothetical protein
MMSYFQRAFTVSRCDMYRISLVAERKTKGTCRMRGGNGRLFSVQASPVLLTYRYLSSPSAFLAVCCGCKLGIASALRCPTEFSDSVCAYRLAEELVETFHGRAAGLDLGATEVAILFTQVAHLQ